MTLTPPWAGKEAARRRARWLLNPTLNGEPNAARANARQNAKAGMDKFCFDLKQN
jgi:hypothetical protein